MTGETGEERRGEGGVSGWVKGRRGRGRGRLTLLVLERRLACEQRSTRELRFAVG